MKRLLTVVSLFLVLALVAGVATAKLSTGDKSKLKKWMTAYFDLQGEEKTRSRALTEITGFFGKKRAKELADVATLAEIMAGATKRPGQRTGVLEIPVQIDSCRTPSFQRS